MDLNITKKVERRDAEEFHDKVIKGNSFTYALKDIPVEKLMNRLEEEIKVASRKTNFKKYADEILSQIDFEEVKRITGTPESKLNLEEILLLMMLLKIFLMLNKQKRNSGGFVPKK